MKELSIACRINWSWISSLNDWVSSHIEMN